MHILYCIVQGRLKRNQDTNTANLMIKKKCVTCTIKRGCQIIKTLTILPTM